MINIILKNKLIAILIAIGILLLLITIFFLFFDKKGTTLTPVNVFTPTSPTQTQNNQQLNILSISPVQNATSHISPSQQLEITFNKPINSNQIKYSITPSTKATLFPKQGSDRIILVNPNPGWATGTTTVTFLPETTDLSGMKMSNSYTYKMNVEFLDTAPAESPGL